MMRAKFELKSVTREGAAGEELIFGAIEENTDDPSLPQWITPREMKMTVTNPNLVGTMKEGEKYYLTFTKAE